MSLSALIASLFTGGNKAGKAAEAADKVKALEAALADAKAAQGKIDTLTAELEAIGSGEGTPEAKSPEAAQETAATFDQAALETAATFDQAALDAAVKAAVEPLNTELATLREQAGTFDARVNAEVEKQVSAKTTELESGYEARVTKDVAKGIAAAGFKPVPMSADETAKTSADAASARKALKGMDRFSASLAEDLAKIDQAKKSA